MSVFKKMKKEGLEQAEDRVGGGFSLFDSDVYDATVKEMWTDTYDSGARFVTATFELGEGRQFTIRETITNKNGDHFFTKTGETVKRPLPGFTLIDDICILTTGEPLFEHETEQKVIQAWDKKANGKIDKRVDMIVAPLGERIKLAILRQIVNKQEKGDNDKYIDTNEQREENVLKMVFHDETGVTVREAEKAERAGDDITEDTAVMIHSWLDANKGKVVNRFKEVKGAGKTGRPSAAPKSGEAAGEKKTSRFGKK